MGALTAPETRSGFPPASSAFTAGSARSDAVAAAALWPEQAIDLAATLRIFTINGAVAGKQAERTGSIEVGKAADFIVLDRNLFAIPVADISDTQVLLTVLDGVPVYQSDGWPGN